MNKTKVILAAVLLLGTASAALAASDNTGNEVGGYVVPGSMDGVNPVYHPGWFPNYPRDSGGQAYGFAPTVKTAHHRTTHERIQDR